MKRLTFVSILWQVAGCSAPLAPWVDADRQGHAAFSNDPRPGVVDSREYKLLLDPAPFGADEAWARSVVWGDLATLALDAGLDVEGDFSLIEKQRDIRFYDVPGSCVLNARGFVFRERVGADGREVTVKYRSPDRYLAAGKDLEVSGEARTKLEEDIAAPFLSRFSQSTTLPVAASKNLNRLDDPFRLVPGMAPYFADLDDHTAIAVVGGTTYAERVFGPAGIDLGPLDAEASLTIWRVGDEPVVVELSYKVEAEDEGFDERSAARALTLFEAMQAHPWVAPDARTKTRTAYERDPAFCDG
ncbi:MAG: hypothetical protein H6737_31255 [Alphaproteobacteria bacterium]|nr:hypothetical protein [Alphaproteobacteria bacterium]